MGRRVHITLTDRQFALLRKVSDATGSTMSELVGQAVERTYLTERIDAFEASFGGWKDRDIDSATYVERMRPGLQARLRKIGAVGRPPAEE